MDKQILLHFKVSGHIQNIMVSYKQDSDAASGHKHLICQIKQNKDKFHVFRQLTSKNFRAGRPVGFTPLLCVVR